MTTPTTPHTSTPPEVQAHLTHLHVDLLEPSLTNPRKHFDEKKLQELAESILIQGIMQPILARPLPGHRVADTAWEPGRWIPRKTKPTHEIVAGERRYRAARLAGLDTVPVLVRHMTDEQVLEAQVVENLQRSDLTELEEAEGYQSLMRLTHANADQVAAKVGKSRSYIYARLKLIDLCEVGRKALRSGQIDASVALLVARIPNEALQAQAIKEMADHVHDGDRISTRVAAAMIRQRFMLRLDEAPFDIKAPALTDAGPCTQCPKRTGANPELFKDLKGSTDLCIDPSCHAAKVSAHQRAKMAQAHARGLTIIEGREAKALMPHAWKSHIEGHLRLDDKLDSPADEPLRKVLAKAMKHTGVQEVLIANPHDSGDLVAVLPTHQVTELLAVAAQLDASQATVDAAAALQEKTQAQQKAERAATAHKRSQEYESAWRWAVLEQVWAKSATQARAHKPDALSPNNRLARHLSLTLGKRLNADRAKRLNKLLGLDKVAPFETLMSHLDSNNTPAALLWVLVAEADVEHRPWLSDQDEANQGLLLAADVFSVNVNAVQESVKADLLQKYFAEDQKALVPLAPAAQADGVRGTGQSETKSVANPGKRKAHSPAALALAKPKTSAQEALQGIAAAMQNEEMNGGDCAPEETKPDGASAVGEDSRATAPDTSPSSKYLDAKALVQKEGRVTVRLLKESMGIGTTKALVLIDQLEASGVVSGCNERGARTVLQTVPTVAESLAKETTHVSDGR